MTQPQYFLGFNGPPGSGKDTLALGLYDHPWVQERFLVYHVKYATPLKIATHALFGGVYTEEGKSQPSPWGPTWRQLYIGMSEDMAKKHCGPTIFGNLLVQHMKDSIASSQKPTLWLCSDCGFEPEQYPVIAHFGPNNVKYLQIVREGHDFSGDSRGYIQPEGVQTLTFLNHQPSVVEAQAEFNFNAMQLINDWGWSR